MCMFDLWKVNKICRLFYDKIIKIYCGELKEDKDRNKFKF